MTPQFVDGVGPGVVEYVKAIGKKGARSVEFGWFGNGDDDHDPLPGEPVRWWAKIMFRGAAYSAEATDLDSQRALMIALGRACAAAGMNIRLRFDGDAEPVIDTRRGVV